LAVKFRLNHLIVAVTLYLPVWYWHCTRARFTVLVPCNDEIADRSYPFLFLQKQIAKLARLNQTTHMQASFYTV